MKDSNVTCNVLQLATALDAAVDMGEAEFRDLLRKLLPNLPSYHISQVTRIVRKGKSVGKMERIAKLTGGLI